MEQSIEAWRRADDPLAFFEQLQRRFNSVQLATALSTQLDGDDLDWALDRLIEINERKPRLIRAELKTIGIYYPRFFNGGVERFLSMIIPMYVRAGYRVIFFTDLIDESIEYPLETGANCIRINLRSDPHKPSERLTELETYVRRFSIELFCSHAVTKILPTVLFFKLIDVPIVLGLHGIFTSYVASRHPLLQPVDKNHKVFRLADGLAVLSRVCEKFWRELGCNAHYIPNPIPDVPPDAPLDRMRRRGTILWVGRIVEAKGVRALVPIMRELVRLVPSAKLRVLGAIGDEELFKELCNQIKAARLEKNIEFCGWHLDVQRFYREADVMLSTSPAEGFSLAIAESKWFALPLVCYELPYLELLRDGRGVISVRQNDARAAAQALARVLTDDRLRIKLLVEARRSREPFLHYDFIDAWRKLFDASMRGLRSSEKNFESEQIEVILLKEIWRSMRNQSM